MDPNQSTTLTPENLAFFQAELQRLQSLVGNEQPTRLDTPAHPQQSTSILPTTMPGHPHLSNRPPGTDALVSGSLPPSQTFRGPVSQPGPQYTQYRQSAPVFEQYQSAHLVQNPGHPAPAQYAPSSSTSSFQPYLGQDRLAVKLSTANVNHGCLTSSSAIPRQPQLPCQGRQQGTAVRPPVIAAFSPTDIQSCHVDGAVDPMICITVNVYPPHVSYSFSLAVTVCLTTSKL